MKKVREVIIVEGRYDKNTVLQAVDGTVLETSGFGIFNDRQKTELIRRLAETRGIIVLTDSDGAGFLIRNHIKGIINGGSVRHAYIPDIYGKEKRKASVSREGKLGVEGMRPEIIIDALIKAGATFEDELTAEKKQTEITKADFYELGLSGKPESSQMRRELVAYLALPEKISANSLLDVVNCLFTKQEFINILNSVKNK